MDSATLSKSCYLNGADVNAKTPAGTTPLHLAVAGGFRSVAELLLEKKTDAKRLKPDHATFKPAWLSVPWQTPAYCCGDRRPIDDRNASGARSQCKCFGSNGPIPLHIAARKGWFLWPLSCYHTGPRSIQKLLRGAGTWLQKLPWLLQLENNLNEMVAFLLQHKADPDVSFNPGQ